MELIRLAARGMEALVQPRGAEIVSCKTAEGREILWQADPSVWNQHAPVLFPVCGNIRNKTLRIGGEPYQMTMHGFCRDADFSTVRKGADFVELELRVSEEIRRMYPFDFVFRVIYVLGGNGYRTVFLVENRSDRRMPFCVGGHPGFICPMEAGAGYEDYELVFPEKEDGWNALVASGGFLDGGETLPCLRDTGKIPLKHAWFDEKDTLVLTHLRSRGVKLINRCSGHGLRMDFPKMEVLAVWSMPGAGADYVCLEPWHGIPDTADATGRFEDKPFATLLQPGESWQGYFEVTLI